METGRETDLPAQQARAQAPPRFPQAHAYARRTPGGGTATGKRPQAAVGVSATASHPAEVMAKATAGSRSRLVTLKTRAEFQRIRKGARWATPAFVLEAKERDTQTAEKVKSEPRFGFTVTRQVGKAVERNRIRRRLKAAVTSVQEKHARAEFDYVLIARRTALESAFGALVADLATALDRVNSGAKRDRRGGASRSRQDRAT